MTAVAETHSSTAEIVELSILMPCLNEAETLETCVRKALTFLEQHRINGEVVVADNGSSDGSQEIATQAGARVVPVATLGYGSALIAGIHAARGKYVIMGDADDSYDFTDLSAFVEKLRQGYDLVMGNRFLGGIKPGAMPPLHRFLGNPVLTAIGRLFFHSDAGDFHSGLRGFSREAILGLDLRTSGMEFASEMVVKASLRRLTIAEVPVILYPDGRSRPPHLRSWRDGWRHLRFLMLFSPRWLFLYPGALLILGGLLATSWLLIGPQIVAKIVFDVHTLVYATLAISLGYQSIIFALFTKVFAVSENLLPPDPRLTRLFNYVTLESGLVGGALMIAGGVFISLYAVVSWRAHSFGALNPSHTLRLVIPAALLIQLGFQTVLSSFFLSVLGLRRR
ncbi:MAG: glycosyltransferase family 2 protein [Chthoniobacterales bacterium]|nr:glycosyltransferase family 2 protein [Chthoniobacterales bacterium]